MFNFKVDTKDCETFDIEYTNSQGLQNALIFRKDGEWALVPRVDANNVWIATARYQWPEVLKRALIILSAN